MNPRDPAAGGERLQPAEIERTLARLVRRIEERFPGAGLAGTALRLLEVTAEAEATVRWIARPNRLLRLAVALLLAAAAAAAGAAVWSSAVRLGLAADGLNISDFVQMVESGLNGLALVGAGLFFLATLEIRRKRARVVAAVNRLRCLAHLVDARQLTKDPEPAGGGLPPTASSPRRDLRGQELVRYLDYCGELLSLAGKVAFLYVQDFPDPVANDAVNDLETLTVGLERKIWQKIMIVHARCANRVKTVE